MGIQGPVTYRVRNVAGNGKRFGMNFAYGGTGVFNTQVPLPNMTTQIDFFEQLIKLGEYNEADLKSSVALVSVSGNDYSAYLKRNNGSFEVGIFQVSGIGKCADRSINCINCGRD